MLGRRHTLLCLRWPEWSQGSVKDQKEWGGGKLDVWMKHNWSLQCRTVECEGSECMTVHTCIDMVYNRLKYIALNTWCFDVIIDHRVQKWNCFRPQTAIHIPVYADAHACSVYCIKIAVHNSDCISYIYLHTSWDIKLLEDIYSIHVYIQFPCMCTDTQACRMNLPSLVYHQSFQ